MSITKEQQQTLNDTLVLREQRLMIGNCNYRLSTTFKPKEPTFQVALDATVSYHKHCINFKMNKKNYSFDLETFRDMLQICPNLLGKKFEDPPFKEEILDFIRELGYPKDIKSLSDVKGMYHQKNVDYVYLLWEDLVYQIENKVSKKNKDMYYPRFTKVIINHFMSKDQSIPRRNKVDWHMANDNPILTIIRFTPKHETVQKYGAILPDTLSNQAMKESDAYKTYHDFATGKVIPKPKYVRRSTREKTDQAPTASPEIALSEAEQMKISSDEDDDDDEVSTSKDDDDDAENEDDDGQDNDNEQTESDNDGDDFIHPKFSTHDEEEKQDEEDKEEEGSDLKDVNVNLERRDTEMTDALQTDVQGTQVIEDTHVIITVATPEVQKQSSSVSPGFISNMLNPNLDTGIDSILNLNTELTSLVDVPVTTNVEMPTSSFEDKVKALEDDFSELKQTNLFAEAVSSILGIVDKYLANKMNEVVKEAVQLQSDRLRDEAQAKNEDFINKLDENIKKIIKEQVKVQIKEQVTKIFPRIKKSVNEQLEDEVLIRSSNEAKTSHVVAANLSELELKKILIDKMENNKSIDRLVQ
ncbi:hypothetical protein Tco_1515084 [Tanacetum coccineum]